MSNRTDRLRTNNTAFALSISHGELGWLATCTNRDDNLLIEDCCPWNAGTDIDDGLFGRAVRMVHGSGLGRTER